jgi:hypothetical protein
MPATLIAPTQVDHVTAVVKPAAVACDNVNGNRFPNSGSLILELTSTAGGTVTVAFTQKIDGQSPAPISYTFTGAQTRLAGGWPPSAYGTELTITASVGTITVVALQV